MPRDTTSSYPLVSIAPHNSNVQEQINLLRIEIKLGLERRAAKRLERLTTLLSSIEDQTNLLDDPQEAPGGIRHAPIGTQGSNA